MYIFYNPCIYLHDVIVTKNDRITGSALLERSFIRRIKGYDYDRSTCITQDDIGILLNVYTEVIMHTNYCVL